MDVLVSNIDIVIISTRKLKQEFDGKASFELKYSFLAGDQIIQKERIK